MNIYWFYFMRSRERKKKMLFPPLCPYEGGQWQKQETIEEAVIQELEDGIGLQRPGGRVERRDWKRDAAGGRHNRTVCGWEN